MLSVLLSGQLERDLRYGVPNELNAGVLWIRARVRQQLMASICLLIYFKKREILCLILCIKTCSCSSASSLSWLDGLNLILVPRCFLLTNIHKNKSHPCIPPVITHSFTHSHHGLQIQLPPPNPRLLSFSHLLPHFLLFTLSIFTGVYCILLAALSDCNQSNWRRNREDKSLCEHVARPYPHSRGLKKSVMNTWFANLSDARILKSFSIFLPPTPRLHPLALCWWSISVLMGVLQDLEQVMHFFLPHGMEEDRNGNI